jgi:hypothetical protein
MWVKLMVIVLAARHARARVQRGGAGWRLVVLDTYPAARCNQS